MTTSTKFSDIVNRIDTVSLKDVVGADAVNIEKLVTSMVKSVLALSFDNVKISDNDKNNINVFLNNIADSVTKFCNFLDYNNNGKVELIRKDSKGNITYGADISAVITDGESVINPIINGNKNIPVAIISTMTNVLKLLTNDNIVTAKNEYLLFKTSCETTYASFSLIKNVNHAKLFNENSDDIMRFIISLCVIIVPLVELVTEKHANGESSISSQDINVYVTKYYGSNISELLTVLESIVSAFVKIVSASSVGKRIKNFFKNLCCTSSSSVNAAN